MYRDSDAQTVSPVPGGSPPHAEPPERDRGPDQPVDASWAQAVEEMSVDQLRGLVLSQPVIEQAKGVLMAYYGLDAAAAFATLRRWSSFHGIKLRTLAALLVDHAPSGPPDRDPLVGPDAGWRPFDGVRAALEATAADRT